MVPFAFIGSGHPLAERVNRLRAAIATRHPAPGATVHADLTLRAEDGAGLVLHRAYWSAQADGPDGFAATTLSYNATRDRAQWLAFPEDPELPAMARIDGPPYRGVLRYMPLRRCTMLSSIEQRTATPMIVKFKRPHRLAASWALLKAVHAALGDGRAGFDVPAPLGLDPPVAYSGQTVLGGEDLSTIADADLLRRAGALHRAMHAAEVPGVPPEDPAQALAELRADARWVAFALPEHADAVRAVMAVLEPRTPRAPRVPAFCHGDLVPSQMLVGERWAITDFDGARIGDPHRDLAIWLASLTSDVPALRAAAEAGDDAAVAQAEGAYLDGYGAHDEARLLWHRGAAELHYAAVALKKDRYHPARLARGLRLARACAETLER